MLLKIINERDFSYSNYPTLRKLFSDGFDFDDIEYLKNKLNNFNKELYKYNSFIHGIYHVEKVFLYCYILGKYLEEPYKTILLDAALYHDIGRNMNNQEDEFHGELSATKLRKLVPYEGIYADKKNRVLLESLVYCHCRDDKYDLISFDDIAYEYDLLDQKMNLTNELNDFKNNVYNKLKNILKDADALDRKRFGDYCFEALDESYLRLDESKKLISFASEINLLYFELMKTKYIPKEKMNLKNGDCFHSIGFDFFKINSVLNNGILSQDAMKEKGLNVPRNFVGGNFDRFISVVDVDAYSKANPDPLTLTSAAKEFSHRSLTFYCSNALMVSPLKNKIEALQVGMPWDKGRYYDEKYALYMIDREDILGIIIPKAFCNTDIKKLNYIYNSLDPNILKRRIEYYKNYTLTSKDDERIIKINGILLEHEQRTINLLKRKASKKEFENELLPLIDEINKYLGELIHEYYCKKLNISYDSIIGVYDVVMCELSSNKQIEFKPISMNDSEIYISISHINEKNNDFGKVKI